MIDGDLPLPQQFNEGKCWSSSIQLRFYALLASILATPLIIVISLAIILSFEWRIFTRQMFRSHDGSMSTRLVFNTSLQSRRSYKKPRSGASVRRKLALFLQGTRLDELPCLLQFAFGPEAPSASSINPKAFVSWDSILRWADATRVPQTRYGDLLMADFNDACDHGDLVLAVLLAERIEADLAGPLRMELDEPRILFNNYEIGAKRLTVVQLRLWHLRHPD